VSAARAPRRAPPSFPTRRSSDLAEVDELDRAALADQHVARLEIAVDDAGAVRGFEAGGDLLQDVLRVLDRHEAALRDHLGERARSEEHTSELQSLRHLVCRLLLE